MQCPNWWTVQPEGMLAIQVIQVENRRRNTTYMTERVLAEVRRQPDAEKDGTIAGH